MTSTADCSCEIEKARCEKDRHCVQVRAGQDYRRSNDLSNISARSSKCHVFHDHSGVGFAARQMWATIADCMFQSIDRNGGKSENCRTR
jgi:hypothetical protein